MGTFDDKSIIDEMIRSNGYYLDDPRIVRIVEYTNMAGKRCWGVVWENEPVAMWLRYDNPTEYIADPKVFWTCLDY